MPALVGFIGHALTDATAYGSIWWSWVIVSAFVGAIIGLAWKRIDIEKGIFGGKEILTFNIYQIVANAVGWGLLAPVLDIIIYAEPSDKVFLQGAVAGLANIVTIAVIGTIFLAIYAKTRTKTGSLSKES